MPQDTTNPSGRAPQLRRRLLLAVADGPEHGLTQGRGLERFLYEACGRVIGEAAGALGQAAGGFLQMVLGGLCGGLFAVLGLVFIIVHFVKAGKAKSAA